MSRTKGSSFQKSAIGRGTVSTEKGIMREGDPALLKSGPGERLLRIRNRGATRVFPHVGAEIFVKQTPRLSCVGREVA